MTKHTTLSRKKLSLLKARQAFSLIELLVVIAVIGIIAAIAIPNIGNLTGGAQTAKNQRNAQNLSSVFSAARASGITNQYTTVTAAVDALTLTGGLTNAAGATFYVPNLTGQDRTDAELHLEIAGESTGGGNNSQLIYSPTARASTN